MSKARRPPTQVISAYEDFVSRFQQAVEDADSSVALSSRGVPNCFFTTNDGVVEFKLNVWVKGWRHRRLGRRRLDVGIVALERLETKSWELVKSTVRVNYMIVSDGHARLVQSLHYDFEKDGQECHPLFHAQLSHELVDLQDVGFNLDMDPLDDGNLCWVTTRIPTPDMTLASVLYCLVADQPNEGVFREFRTKVQPAQDRLPSLTYDALKDSVERSSHFKSSHWFAHMG